MNNEIDFKYNECIKEQNNFGETIYHNICNGETYKVSVGDFTIFLYIIVSVLIISFILALILLVIDTFRY